MHCQFWSSTKTFRSFNECSTLEALSVVHSMYKLSFYITLLFVMCHTCLNGFIVVPVIGISSSCGHYQRDWCVWYFISYCLMHMHVLVLPQLYLLIVFHECNVIFFCSHFLEVYHHHHRERAPAGNVVVMTNCRHVQWLGLAEQTSIHWKLEVWFDCPQPRCPWSASWMLPVLWWPICEWVQFTCIVCGGLGSRKVTKET